MKRGSQPEPGREQAAVGVCPLGARPLVPFAGLGLAWSEVLDQLQVAEAKTHHGLSRRGSREGSGPHLYDQINTWK